MSLIVKFDGNMNVISRLLKEYRIKKNLSYEQLCLVCYRWLGCKKSDWHKLLNQPNHL